MDSIRFPLYQRDTEKNTTSLVGVVPLLASYRPYFREVFPGGLEVVGWVVSPWWGNLAAWAKLLIDRNLHGLLAYDQNPEPWPGFYWGILEAERSHLEVSWPLVCDDEQPVLNNFPIALRQFTPRDWRRITILKFGGNPCR